MVFSRRNLFASRDQQQSSSATTTAIPSKSTSTTPSLLEERLRSIGVCELHQNGESSHSIMSLRALYNHVATNITDVCVDDNGNTTTASSSTGNKRFNIPSPKRLAKLQHDIGREQLGAYLQPRDMRHLVTPFFSSDEPTLLVRRHVILMKFDPVRAVVLHDRVLLLNTKEIKDVGDYMLEALEKRLMNWRKDSMEDEIFGTAAEVSGHSEHYGPPKKAGSRGPPKKVGSHMLDEIGSKMKEVMGSKAKEGVAELGSMKLAKTAASKDSSEGSSKKDEKQTVDSETKERQQSNHYHDEYGIAFELRIIDVILQTVVAIMKKEAKFIIHRTTQIIDAFKQNDFHSNNHSGAQGEQQCSQDILQLYRDEIDAMDSRVNNFIRALSKICDDEKQLALMNLSRLLTHPDRFVKPTNEILLEESDESELIIEAYLTEGFKILNQLQLLHKQVSRTEKDLSMNLDAMRNRLLYINTMISVANLIFGMGAFIGGMFGVNVPFSLNSDPYAFRRIWIVLDDIGLLRII
jgi:magnesium transporter